MTTKQWEELPMSGQTGFGVQDEDYRFACLSFLEDGDQVSEAWTPPPTSPITTTHTHAHPDTLISLRGQLCQKPCIPVSKALELEVAAAVSRETERPELRRW